MKFFVNNKIRLIWEITHKCNLNCSHCFYGDGFISPASYLKRKELEIILHQIKQLSKEKKIMELNLTGGEPLLFPYFEKIIKFCNQENIPYSINTNATLWEGKHFELIERYPPLGVMISLDGVNEETYLAMRGKPYFNKVLDTIKKLVKIKEKLKKKFYIDIFLLLQK